jgi:hypothetical protein
MESLLRLMSGDRHDEAQRGGAHENRKRHQVQAVQNEFTEAEAERKRGEVEVTVVRPCVDHHHVEHQRGDERRLRDHDVDQRRRGRTGWRVCAFEPR